jgi:hypothetical protein
MKQMSLWFVGSVMLFVLAGHSSAANDRTSKDDSSTSNEAGKPESGSPRCPSKDFSAFAIAFAEDVQIQKAFTRYLLARTWYVDSSPEPIAQAGLFKQDELEFPIIDGRDARARAHLTLKARVHSNSVASLKLWKEDTDYQLVYTFEKKGCWFLTKLDNMSI